MTTILAIETSCDETAAAIVSMDAHRHCTVRSSVVASQIALHAPWGGVVPQIAAREHQKAIVPVIQQSLSDAAIDPRTLDAIAVTQGPGLMPALMIGVSAARTLAYAWHKPLIGTHHIEGHIYAPFIAHETDGVVATSLALRSPSALFPLLALVVSGGHTQLVLMRDHLTYTIVGETQDDAVGEAFDKVARMLGLPYPGGPAIAAAATQHMPSATDTITLPRPMLHSGDLHFSFSGIKTAVLYQVRDFRVAHNLATDASLPKPYVAAMSAAFQDAVTDVLIAKTCHAAKLYAARTVIIAGGVSANTALRARLGTALAQKQPDVYYTVPTLRYCLDNAAMIGTAALYRWHHSSTATRSAAQHIWRTLDPDPSLRLGA